MTEAYEIAVKLYNKLDGKKPLTYTEARRIVDSDPLLAQETQTIRDNVATELGLWSWSMQAHFPENLAR